MDDVYVNQLKNRLTSQLGFTADQVQDLSSKLSDLDKVRLWSGLRFIDQENDPLSMIFFLESLVAIKHKGKSGKLQDLFAHYGEPEEKIELIDRFLFSRPFKFGAPPGETRHVLFDDFRKDQTWIDNNVATSTNWQKWCSSGPSICFCIQWLREQHISIDPYLRVVVNNLYQMRCAVVHESFPVIFLPHPTSPGESERLSDCYPAGPKPDDFVSYTATIQPERFFEIAKNVARRYLLSMI